MENFLLINETWVRLSAFFGIFALVAVWEGVAPRRKLTQSKGVRWLNNLALVMLNSLLLRLGMPLMATGMALYASQNQFGLLNWLRWGRGSRWRSLWFCWIWRSIFSMSWRMRFPCFGGSIGCIMLIWIMMSPQARGFIQ